MSQLWIFYEDACQLFPLTGQEDCIFIGNKLVHHVTIPSFLFRNGYVEIRQQTDASAMTVLQGDKPIGELKPYVPVTVDDDGQTLTVVWMDKEIKQHIYYVGNKTELMVAPDPQADIQMKTARASFVKQQGEWFVVPNHESPLFLNGAKISDAVSLQNGDVILCPYAQFVFLEDDLLAVASSQEITSSLTETVPPVSEMKKKYPVYHRTPRMIYELPSEKFAISFQSKEGDGDQRGL